MRLWKEPSGKNASVRIEATKDGVTKLFGTTYRAWMIACFQEMHRISKRFGADFDMVVDFFKDTHRVRSDRPVMFLGAIGGHCLIPNAEILSKSYDSTFFDKTI